MPKGAQADDDRPIETSARKPPPRAYGSSSDAFPLPPPKRQAKAVDPRFDSLHGALQSVQFSQHYKFLHEMQQQEQQDRLVRIRLVGFCLRRLRLERALAVKKLQSVVASRHGGKHAKPSSGKHAGNAGAHSDGAEGEEGGYSLEELEEIVAGMSDEEDEAITSTGRRGGFEQPGEAEAAAGEQQVAQRRQMMEELRHEPYDTLQQMLLDLKHHSTLFKSKTANARALTQQSSVKRELMKKELRAVKDGKKSKVFIPKRKEVKSKILEKTYESLAERGGQQMVSTYLERKAKRQR